MDTPYTYSETLKLSERIAWRLEDILRPGDALDFSAPFLPEGLASSARAQGLDDSERRTLNQLRGYSYLCLFGLVEEFILPFVLDHARDRAGADRSELRALLQFASEEAKHIELFKRFAREFEDRFGSHCDVIGPAREIASAVLAHSSLGVGLSVLHIEWMTQRHYVESVKSDVALDPLFKRLLHYHWLEEAQHAKLDTLIVHQLGAQLGSSEIQQGIRDYESILGLLKGGLHRQAELDLENLERATGQELPKPIRTALLRQQQRSYDAVFIESGTQHPRFQQTLAHLSTL